MGSVQDCGEEKGGELRSGWVWGARAGREAAQSAAHGSPRGLVQPRPVPCPPSVHPCPLATHGPSPPVTTPPTPSSPPQAVRPPALPTSTANQHCPPALSASTVRQHCPPALSASTACQRRPPTSTDRPRAQGYSAGRPSQPSNRVTAIGSRCKAHIERSKPARCAAMDLTSGGSCCSSPTSTVRGGRCCSAMQSSASLACGGSQWWSGGTWMARRSQP